MKKWLYRPAPTFGWNYLRRLQAIPKEKDLFQSGMRLLFFGFSRLFLRLYFRFMISGNRILSEERASLLVANHSSHLDIFCLMAALPLKSWKRVHIAAAEDVFYTNKLFSLLASLLLNTFPFDRKHYGLKGLKHCKTVLKTPGQILIIFPEGSRTRNGEVQPFKEGIGHLVARSSAEVIPCGI